VLLVFSDKIIEVTVPRLDQSLDTYRLSQLIKISRVLTLLPTVLGNTGVIISILEKVDQIIIIIIIYK
jgi:hypothetical protein